MFNKIEHFKDRSTNTSGFIQERLKSTHGQLYNREEVGEKFSSKDLLQRVKTRLLFLYIQNGCTVSLIGRFSGSRVFSIHAVRTIVT